MLKYPFIHLRTQSSYSLAESTIKINKLVDLAKQHNMPAIALTDNNNMFGALEFSIECQKNGIQPIIGTTINLLDISYNNYFAQISLLVMNEEGYENLLYLSSISHTQQNEHVGILTKELLKHSKGLIAYIGGEYNPLLFCKLKNKINDYSKYLNSFLNIYKDNFYIELQRIKTKELENYENELIKLASDFEIPLIASNNIKFISKNDYNAHDALLCIAHKSTINQENRIRSNPNLFFKSTEQMHDLFNDIPEIIDNNFKVALKCNFYPKEKNPKLPKFISESKLDEKSQLIEYAKEGLLQRLEKVDFDGNDTVISKTAYLERLDYELNIINKMGFAGYFLIVADFVQWAKKNDIPVGPGRGSGAGSLVAWSLTITDLDPNKRDEVKEYVNNKYGNDRVALIITFGTLSSRAVVRDVGRVLEVPYSEVDKFAKLIPYNPSNPLSLKDSINSDQNIKNYIKNDERIASIIETSFTLEGLHRHASTHAAGVVIGDEDLIKSVPLYKDPDTSINATQFSMKYVEKAGLIKFDFLGLTTLSIINDVVRLIKESISG